MRRMSVIAACLVTLLGLGGCSAGACFICDAEDDTAAYTYLTTESKEALCSDCVEDGMGSPDTCAWCDEGAEGFYVNLLEIPVFTCQDCYDELS